MSRSAGLLKRLLPKLYEGLDDELADEEYCPSSKDIVEELCDDVLERCAATVAKFKKEHNASLPHARLPPEIWCLIWSRLAKRRLIAVTHVCRAWRVIATDYAPFWKDVHFFTTVHSRMSRCGVGTCECHEALLWKDDEEPQAIHNLHKVATWLGRSKGARITMSIRAYPLHCNHDLALQLAEVVRPHAHRIASLTYMFGDLAFFIKFLQHIGAFHALRFLRMRHLTPLQGEQYYWPLSTMQLENLELPRLREFRGYGDFWWDIPRPPDARSLGNLQRLRCNFKDARAFYHCLRSCPNLVFLNAELSDYPTTHVPPAPPDDVATLVPRLRDLILDRITRTWQAAVLPIINRSAFRIFTLRCNSFDADTVFHSLHHLSDDVELSFLPSFGSIELQATDSHGRSFWLELRGDAATNALSLSLLWNHVQTRHLSALTVGWALRGALLSKRLIAPGVEHIELVVESADAGAGAAAQLGISELMELQDGPRTAAGRPSFPNLAVLEVTASRGAEIVLPATSVRDFAAALTERECAIELDDVVLQD